MIKSDDVFEKIDRGKIHAMFDLPMIEGDVSKMPVVLTTEIKTAATDGNTTWVNPHFVNLLDDFEIEFVVLHEWAHVFLKHFSRSIKLPNKELVQLATDEEANHLLEKAGIRIIPGAICTPGYRDMTMEQIYRHLESQLPPAGDEPGDAEGGGEETEKTEETGQSGTGEESDGSSTETNDDGDDDSENKSNDIGPGEEIEPSEDYKLPPVSEWGEVKDPGVLSGEEEEQVEFEDTIRQETAMATASLNGKLPAAVEEHVRSISAKSKIDWKMELADFVDQAMNGFDGYLSWSKPNKRFAGLGIHMPSIIPESEQIAILLDSSGSMDNDMFNYALKETKSIIDLAQPDVTHVVTFDHDIVGVDSYEMGVEFPDRVGRRSWGGTNIKGAFDHVSDNLDVNGIIVISDMEFFGGPEDPGIPVIWVEIPSTEYGFWGGFSLPFGRAIRVDKNA